MPANLPVAAYGNAGTYSDMVYIKGALFFHNLRQAIGDDAFFRILREYYAAYKYGIARGQDFLRLATSIGGPAVQDIYATWIEGSRK
jgi:aminopeptidase N